MAKSMKGLMKQAQKMQKDMMKMQEELATKEFEGSASGGLVQVKVNGHGDLTTIKLDPEVVDPDDVEMLEDLILAAVKNAKDQSSEASNSSMSGITGGMNIPGLM